MSIRSDSQGTSTITALDGFTGKVSLTTSTSGGGLTATASSS
ncbi:MAG: hypothetical protein ABR909_01805 [Candidatus Bathyarchaeia archaeon]